MGRSRILVVDDDRDLCDLLAEVLIEEGYEVARASLEKPFSLAAVQSAVEAVLGPNTDAPAGP